MIWYHASESSGRKGSILFFEGSYFPVNLECRSCLEIHQSDHHLGVQREK